MEIIRDTEDFYIDRPTAVCIGKFDGVHVGHRKLIECITRQKQAGLLATVFTFDPSPEELFSGKKSENLCSRIEKEAYLEELGVDIVLEYPLTFENAAVDPTDFVKNILIGQMNMKYIAAGSDISFGKGGNGNRELIEGLSTQYGFKCDIIEKIRVDGKEVSSSRIRHAIEEGHVEEAYRMLGRAKG